MKKPFLAFIALAVTAVFASAQTKIVTVNVQQCFDGYHKSVDFSDLIGSMRENIRTAAREKETALRSKAEPLELRVQEIRENPGLSDAAKEEQLRELQPEIQAFQQEQQEYQQWLQEEQQKATQQAQNLRRTILDEIKRIAGEIGIREGADIVLDSSDAVNQGLPAVIYASSSTDITNKVLRELNKDAPSE